LKIYGHRGASGVEPENTLRAFARSLEMGAEGIELDVQVSADRVPVVLHDRNFDRTTNGTGAVDLLSLEELRTIDAGQGERVPLLSEVLALVGDRAHFDVEIKQGGIEREVLDVLAASPDSRWGISSFDWVVLERVRELSADAELWVLAVFVSEAMFNLASRIGARGVSLYSDGFTEESARALADAGLDVIVWTVNDPAEARRVRDLGAAGLCTDVPDVIIAGLA
jgi:glycerophosphoryl diester phosphodiesterase